MEQCQNEEQGSLVFFGELENEILIQNENKDSVKRVQNVEKDIVDLFLGGLWRKLPKLLHDFARLF